MRKRRLPPDTRPNWRDPNLKCIATHKTKGTIEVTPEIMQRAANHRLIWDAVPTYDKDPSYNWSKTLK